MGYIFKNLCVLCVSVAHSEIYSKEKERDALYNLDCGYLIRKLYNVFIPQNIRAKNSIKAI
jgi:hypothetical protein